MGPPLDNKRILTGGISMLTDVKIIEDQEEEKPEQPKTPKKKTVEACKICDNNCGYCKYNCNCYTEVEV
ncbi:MAG: hypothetical protein IKY42_10855, partial [Bacteroidaceae bacterium]|nr:hypothetical protein [Bacteroidaceae bacterium]